MEESYEALAQQLAGSHVRVAKFQADKEDKEWCKENLKLTTFPSIVMLPKASSSVVKYPDERRDVETMGMWVRTMAGTA
jgi:adenylyl-sulfate reductase (glutathione)